jgi:hypothetical protein
MIDLIMKGNFDLELTFAAKDYKFPVATQSWGEGKRYAIKVKDVGYLFTPDSKGKFSYVIVPGQPVVKKDMDTDLLAAIAKEFEKLDTAHL